MLLFYDEYIILCVKVYVIIHHTHIIPLSYHSVHYKMLSM